MSTVADAVPEQEFAYENPARVVWTLAWPAVALNSLQVVNTLLDRGFIGHLHAAALTAQGGATNVMFLMFSLAISIATGATALVSRSFGADERRQVRQAARQSLSLAIYAGIAMMLLTTGIAHLTAEWIMPPGALEAKRDMTYFVMAYGCGLPGIFIIQTLAGSLRGIGDTRSPMVISGIQILLHILLNFLLIFPAHRLGPITVPGAGLGLLGAGCALSGSATLSSIAYILYARRTPLGKMQPFRLPERAWAQRILRIAIPAAVMSTLRVFSLTAFMQVLKQVPNAEDAIGALSLAFALESIMFMPAFGLSSAAAALVGQSLGMKRPDRAEQLGWMACRFGAGVTLVLALPLFLGAEPIATVLVPGNPGVIHEASMLLKYLCATEFLFGTAMVLMGAMQGAGDTVRPLWIAMFCLWGLRVPLAILLTLPKGFALGGFLPLPIGAGMGTTGAWWALTTTQGLQGVLAFLVFRQGKWKTQKV
ncbi:MATE family efflux transporter [Fimbriimonas ginsengisoli]|uniref:Probable multidrug resistance protein NorM n=1 Tax=Fimbriimonas ginsengisoli Gsoil 348 TaxID=661478 RepID=A0A068NTZ7_FIMGI|nr:MATE family efflux transporter [Fimbriimonas ginsengisoli]AIE87008.1 DNA damage-inducible protein [Fimbriimonas ginsengisoli Gsoil 348]